MPLGARDRLSPPWWCCVDRPSWASGLGRAVRGRSSQPARVPCPDARGLSTSAAPPCPWKGQIWSWRKSKAQTSPLVSLGDPKEVRSTTARIGVLSKFKPTLSQPLALEQVHGGCGGCCRQVLQNLPLSSSGHLTPARSHPDLFEVRALLWGQRKTKDSHSPEPETWGPCAWKPLSVTLPRLSTEFPPETNRRPNLCLGSTVQ